MRKSSRRWLIILEEDTKPPNKATKESADTSSKETASMETDALISILERKSPPSKERQEKGENILDILNKL